MMTNKILESQFLNLNIASSTILLDNFINLDKSIYIKLARYYPLVKYFIPLKYKEQILIYRKALQSGNVMEHDCRKILPFPANSVNHILCSHFLEHVYPDEAMLILKDFYRILKIGGTLHLVLPDMKILIQSYLDNKTEKACDYFIESTLLTRAKRPTIKYRMLELAGQFGLQHYWMYDLKSMKARLIKTGFNLTDEESIPSKEFRKDDNISFHLLVRKL